MKSIMRIACMFFMLVLLFSLCTIPASAEPIDETRSCSLTLQVVCGGKPVEKQKYTIYRIGKLSGSGPAVTLLEPYASYPISLDGLQGEDWADLAETLRVYISDDSSATPYDSGVTDSAGKLVFSELPCGLYLVVGENVKIKGDVYKVTPFLISLPSVIDGTWQYSCVAMPKMTKISSGPISLRVLKIWDDKGYESSRPEEITVKLLCDGEVFESVTLTEENSWRWHWEELDPLHDWTVVEDPIPEKYTVSMELIEDCYRITNHSNQTPPPSPTPSPTPSNPPGLPQTGLNWWPVLGFGSAGVLLLLLALVFRRIGGREDMGDEE